MNGIFKKGSDANKQAGRKLGALAQQWLGPTTPQSAPMPAEKPFPLVPVLAVAGVLVLVIAMKK